MLYYMYHISSMGIIYKYIVDYKKIEKNTLSTNVLYSLSISWWHFWDQQKLLNFFKIVIKFINIGLKHIYHTFIILFIIIWLLILILNG